MVTVAGDPEAVRGVNDRTQLAEAEQVLLARTKAREGAVPPPM